MKLMRVAISGLVGVWLSACAVSPVVETPPPDSAPAVDVMARLQAQETRLERLEQAVATLGSAQQALQAQQVAPEALEGMRGELRQMRAALDKLRHQQRQQQQAAAAPRPVPVVTAAGSAASDTARYRAVDIDLGPLPDGSGSRLLRPIPATVPGQAREILVYVQIATGYVEGGPHRFRIATRLDDSREAAFYLYAVGQAQQGWAYNSDSFWLPMPANRELILDAEGKPFFGDWNSNVRIIAYR